MSNLRFAQNTVTSSSKDNCLGAGWYYKMWTQCNAVFSEELLYIQENNEILTRYAKTA